MRVRVCSITIGDSGDVVTEAEIPNGIDASVIAMDQEMAIVKNPVYIKVYPLILANGYVASITCILKLPAPPINIPSAQSYEEWKDVFGKYLLQIDLPGILPLIIYIIHVIVYMLNNSSEATAQFRPATLFTVPIFGKKRGGMATKHLMRWFWERVWEKEVVHA